MGYKFGSSWGNNLRPSAEWQYYFTSQTDAWVNVQIQKYIRDGVLEQRAGGFGGVPGGSLIRVAPKYWIASPGTYTRETAGTAGLPIVEKSALYQTFHIERATGFFATSIDIYFCTKSKNDPVTISIVTTREGRPLLNQLPYSAVTLNPDEVNEDETGETFTTFTLPSPVYLTGGEKYAIRIMSKGDSYKVKLGRDSIGEKKNAALDAVFFASN